jgi:hypothetical protein
MGSSAHRFGFAEFRNRTPWPTTDLVDERDSAASGQQNNRRGAGAKDLA